MTTHLFSYLPQDRLRVLAGGELLPETTTGSALFADISGFTPLFKELADKLGPQRAAEEMTRLLNQVYESLIGQVDQQQGSIIDFVGDAITCWFADDAPPLRAATCALAMQREMAAFAHVEAAPGVTAELSVKIGLACGPARRFLVGDPAIRRLDALAGETLSQMSQAEGLAARGEIVLAPTAVVALGEQSTFAAFRRHPESGATFAVLEGLTNLAEADPWPPTPALDVDQIRSWLPAPLFARLQTADSQVMQPELRPVLALFLRFSGIDYDHDPDAGQKLDAFIRWVQQTVAHYDGRLIQLTIGDKGSFLYVVFGALTAHDDDALRAVSAAKSLLALPDELQFITPHIGIAAGQARTGTYGSSTRRSFGAIGSDVVLAARLMMAAPAGEIRVAHGVYRQTRGREQFESLPPIRVKGRADLLRVYRPAVAQQPSASDGRTEMVGRQEEAATLERLLTGVQRGAAQVLTIEGEAGIGKSRLVAQLQEMMAQQDLAGLFGAGLSIEQQTPYRAWRDVLEAYFDLGDLSDSAQRRTRVAAVVGELIPEHERQLPVLNDVLGLDFPENDLTQTLDAQLRQQNVALLLIALLQAWAAERPLILILEDAHWLDALSWQLAAEVARALSLAELPFLFVLVHRPLAENSNGRQVLAELGEMEAAQTLKLTALSPEAITALTAGRLHVPAKALPAALVELVQSRAQGNPFFAEELLINLRDTAVIQTSENECQIVGDLEAAGRRLPDTLHGLVLSRIDRLPPERQFVLKVAAVLGRAFAFSPLFYTLNRYNETVEGTLKGHLTALENADFTLLASLEPELTYLFKHIITQEAAYQTLLFAQRRELHRAAAAWYESQTETRPFLPLLVYHYRYAEEVAKERHYLHLAGAAAQKAYANDDALGFYGRLLTLAPADEKPEIHLRRGRIRELIGRWDEAEADYRAALALAEGEMAANAQLALGKLCRLRGDYAHAFPWLAQARAGYRALDDNHGLMLVLIETGVVFQNQSEYEQARASLEEGLVLARMVDDQAGIAQALNQLGIVAQRLGELVQARTLYNESLAIRRALGDRQGEAETLQNLGLMTAETDIQHEARDLYTQSLAICRDIGDRQGIASLLNKLGNLALEIGDLAEAQALYAESLALRRQLGDKKGIAHSLNNLGLVAVNREAFAEARAAYEECLALNRQIGDQWGVAMPLTNLGGVALKQGDVVAAEAFFEEALALWQRLGVKQGVIITLNNLGYVLAIQEKLTAARVRFEKSIEMSEEMGDLQNIGLANLGLGLVALGEQNPQQARQHSLVALQIDYDAGRLKAQIAALIALAGLALLEGRAERAAYLLGVVDAANKALNLTTAFYVNHFHDQTMAAVRQALTEAAFRAAWQEGGKRPLEETVKDVLNQV
jgi:predicted ATPase